MFITELQAVNFIRGSVGTAPISSLNTANPDVSAARERLRNSALEIQASQWWFNSEYGFMLPVDTVGNIKVPANALEVRPLDPFNYVAVRGDRLYDPYRNTFQFSEGIKCDMVLNLDFADLPFVAANYAQYDAARKYQADFDGDPARVADLRQDASIAWAKLKEQDLRNRRKNIMFMAGNVRMNARRRPYGSPRRFRPGE